MTNTEKKTIVEALIRLYGKVEIKTEKDRELIKQLLEILGEKL